MEIGASFVIALSKVYNSVRAPRRRRRYKERDQLGQVGEEAVREGPEVEKKGPRINARDGSPKTRRLIYLRARAVRGYLSYLKQPEPRIFFVLRCCLPTSTRPDTDEVVPPPPSTPPLPSPLTAYIYGHPFFIPPVRPTCDRVKKKEVPERFKLNINPKKLNELIYYNQPSTSSLLKHFQPAAELRFSNFGVSRSKSSAAGSSRRVLW